MYIYTSARGWGVFWRVFPEGDYPIPQIFPAFLSPYCLTKE